MQYVQENFVIIHICVMLRFVKTKAIQHTKNNKSILYTQEVFLTEILLAFFISGSLWREVQFASDV